MHFALLGDHPDGLDMARALVESGRHELLLFSGAPVAAEFLRRWGINARPVGDVEEILADPAIDGVIVAGKPADRAATLRRALQAERHVLCIHPADDSPDIAYEAAMIQADTRVLLLPLLPEVLHPGVRRLAQLLRSASGGLRLVEMERSSTEAVLLDADVLGHKPSLPGWDVLRLIGGEIVEVVGLAALEELNGEQPLLLAGRFERGGLFQTTLVPHQAEPCWRMTVRTGYDHLELTFAEGWPGPSRLTWRDDQGVRQEEVWDSWNPWPALVEVFEAASTGIRAVARPLPFAQRSEGKRPVPVLSWQDEVRCLELDDAARRSVERRRASTLEYQEVTEEAGFKGTMTLVGCGLLWGSLVLLLLSAWLPWLLWAIVPGFALFLTLQLLRWVVPPKPEQPKTRTPAVQDSPAAPAPPSTAITGERPDSRV
jgi:hypothetical protein